MPVYGTIERTAFADFDLEALTKEEQSAALAQFAAEQRDAVIEENKPSGIDTWVDGRHGAPLETVSPTGVVRFEFAYLADIAAAIYQRLVAASPAAPKRDGAKPATHYRAEHMIMIDGTPVEEVPQQISASSEVTFVNLQPYARKIEAGMSIQAPNGVYEATAALMRRQYGNITDISFTYIEMQGVGPISYERRVLMSKSQRRTDDRFPAITVRSVDR